jgi:hypothetical protein
VSDIDMLSLDHIKDDGAADRAINDRRSLTLYRWLEKNSFPDGYQTLCCNHQWKKEILRRQAGRMSVKKS